MNTTNTLSRPGWEEYRKNADLHAASDAKPKTISAKDFSIPFLSADTLFGDPDYEERQLSTQRIMVGLRIRRERLLWGMTQEQLSIVLGISPNYLGQIERGNRDLSRKMENRICELFHLDRNDLHSIPDQEKMLQVAEDNIMFPRLNQIEIDRLLASCSPSELAFCGQVLRYLLLCLRNPSANAEESTAMMGF